MKILNVACSAYGLDSTAELKPSTPQLTATEVYGSARTLLRTAIELVLYSGAYTLGSYGIPHAQQTATVWSGLYGNMLWSGPNMYGIQLPRLHCKQLLF